MSTDCENYWQAVQDVAENIVAEMARMCSPGRSRFYQLIGNAFPEPSRDDRGRPYYTAEQQQVCLCQRFWQRSNLSRNCWPSIWRAT